MLYQLTGFLQGKQKIGFRRRRKPRQMVIPRSTARSSAGRTAFRDLSAAISVYHLPESAAVPETRTMILPPRSPQKSVSAAG